MSIVVDEKMCIGCGFCVPLCPPQAMELSPRFVVRIDEEKCTECLDCIDCCTNDALEEA